MTRRDRLLASLEQCDSDSARIKILVDRVLSLEDSLFELQQTYFDTLNQKLCVQTQF